MHEIFKGRKAIPEAELRAGLISGGTVALAEKLRNSHLDLGSRRDCGQPLGGLEFIFSSLS